MLLPPVFFGAVPPPEAGVLGHGVTAAVHLLGHVVSGQMAMCPEDVDRNGQPLPIGSQRGGHVVERGLIRHASCVSVTLSGTAPGLSDIRSGPAPHKVWVMAAVSFVGLLCPVSAVGVAGTLTE